MIRTMNRRSHPGRNLLNRSDWQAVAERFGLSQRELQVAQLLFEGVNRDSIALLLTKPDGTRLSPETIRVYIDRLYRKLAVDHLAGLVLRILLALDRCSDVLPRQSGIERHP